MKSEFPIVVALNRSFGLNDEKAINLLFAKWLIYDCKVVKRSTKTEIELFHSTAAKPHLLRELSELFPDEHLTAM